MCNIYTYMISPVICGFLAMSSLSLSTFRDFRNKPWLDASIGLQQPKAAAAGLRRHAKAGPFPGCCHVRGAQSQMRR